MKKKKIIKTIRVFLRVIISCLLASYILQLLGWWEMFDRWSTLVGLPGAFFAYSAWTTVKEKNAPIAVSGEDSVAIMFTMGTGNVTQVADYIRRYINLNKANPDSNIMNRVNVYESINSGELKPTQGKVLIPDTSAYAFENLDVYAVNTRGSQISIRACRDKDSNKGRYIEVSSPKIKNNEESIQNFLKDYVDTMKNLQEFFSDNGISEIHLFQGGFIPAALAIQNAYSNQYIVYTYHWGGGTYLLAGKLDKGADAL